MKKPAKTPKGAAHSAKHKAAKNRAFPYAKVAKMWARAMTIPQIGRAIGRVGTGDDPYHALRVALTKMHKGYKNAEGDIVKLPHRVSLKTVKLATKAGKRAAA